MRLKGPTIWTYPTKRHYTGNHVWFPKDKVEGEWFAKPTIKKLQHALDCLEKIAKNTTDKEVKNEIQDILKDLQKKKEK